jgi:hypothetical protein
MLPTEFPTSAIPTTSPTALPTGLPTTSILPTSHPTVGPTHFPTAVPLETLVQEFVVVRESLVLFLFCIVLVNFGIYRWTSRRSIRGTGNNAGEDNLLQNGLLARNDTAANLSEKEGVGDIVDGGIIGAVLALEEPENGSEVEVQIRDVHPDASIQMVDVNDDLNVCVMCLDARKTYIAVPCGHVILCDECHLAGNINIGDECPLCRERIQLLMKIHL